MKKTTVAIASLALAVTAPFVAGCGRPYARPVRRPAERLKKNERDAEWAFQMRKIQNRLDYMDWRAEQAKYRQVR